MNGSHFHWRRFWWGLLIGGGFGTFICCEKGVFSFDSRLGFGVAAGVALINGFCAGKFGVQFDPAQYNRLGFRKARPGELRWYSAFFAFIPIWGALGIYFGHSYLDRAAPLRLWLYATSALLVLSVWLWVWAKFVPAKVSWSIGAVVWLITLWLALTDRLV